MQTVSLVQGSHEWHQHRARYFNASDAPAMMNKSPYKTRTELLREKKTGISQEVDAATQRRFSDGHRFEKLAKAFAEGIIGEELFPVVGVDGEYSASFDGLNMDDDIIFEHKTLNDDIRNTTSSEELRIDYRIQMEQQLMVSGANKCLFVGSKWSDDGSMLEEKHFWYYADIELRQQIIDGWQQFKKDLETFEIDTVSVSEPPKAEAVKDLPVVSIQVKGELTSCNLDTIKPIFDKFLSEAKIDLVTEEDFAQAEAEAKAGRKAAKGCLVAADAAINQMLSVSDVVNTLKQYAEKFNKTALAQEKAVKDQKELRKTQAKLERDKLYADHVKALESEIHPIRLVIGVSETPSFVEVMKNQRTLKSIYNNLDSELARAKIAADAIAKDVREKLAWCKESCAGYGFLFSDLQQLIYKPVDDFKLTVTSRINDHKDAEQKRLDDHKDAEQKRLDDSDDLAKAVENEDQKPEKNPVLQPIAGHTPYSHVDMFDPEPSKAESGRPTDIEILKVLVGHYRVHESKVVEWLLEMDLDALVDELMTKFS